MLQINGKTFMNLQEAVQWLLDNNALPFQSSANYIANTEIGLGTIINPSPAKVRIGSLIFFADSKVSTVTGLTENGFIVSDQYNDLVDDVVYVSNVALNASGHLIVTLSNGNTIDAGLIKQVTGFSIDGSQHLIVGFNDGTSTDLGAIFNGNVNIAGNFTADSIIENMTGYSFAKDGEATNLTREHVYAGVVKNGNKLTFVIAMNITRTGAMGNYINWGSFTIPLSVASKLYPSPIINDLLEVSQVEALDSFTSTPVLFKGFSFKNTPTQIKFQSWDLDFDNKLTLNTTYYVRYEVTFLLGANMAS